MKKLITSVAIILVLSVLLTACGKAATTTTNLPGTTTAPSISTTTTAPVSTTPVITTASPSPAITKGGTLRYVYPYSPTSIPGWPNDRTNTQRLWTMWTVFEPLVKLDAKYKPLPWLASSWEWGPQNQYVTFTLRQDVKFHDGTAFTAEAVKMEGDLVISTKESNAINWDRWEIIDDYHIRLFLKNYTNDFWGGLCVVNMCFFSPTAYKANGVDYMKDHPIGTGPFTYLSFEKDVSLKFKKNPNYWQPGKPYLDQIDMLTIKEPLTQQTTMQAGEGDILALQSGKILSDMKKLGFSVIAAYGGTDLLLFDTANADSQFTNVKVRQAIEYAIDKQTMVDAQGYGYLVKNNQMSPPDNPSFNPNLPSRDYDPAKAKALLTEAGYPNGLQIKIITVGAEPKVLAIQQYLKAVGINASLESVDNAKFWNYNMKGWSGMLDSGFAVGPNFPAWVKSYFPPTGIFDISTKLTDSVLAQLEPALKEQDPVKAKQLSDQIIKELYEQAYVIPVFSSAKGFIVSNKVHDTDIFKFVDYSVWSPENIWLSK
jgi:peptide/nickel transport system substrate-binding protein